jgi:hypothetical protein
MKEINRLEELNLLEEFERLEELRRMEYIFENKLSENKEINLDDKNGSE